MTAAVEPHHELEAYPEWAREVYAWLPAAAQIVLTGNVDDRHLAPRADGRITARRTSEIVADCLRHSGFTVVLRFNAVAGLDVLFEHEPNAGSAAAGDLWSRRNEATADYLTSLLHATVRHGQTRVGLVVEDAPRLAPVPDDPDLHRLYASARYLSHEAPATQFPSDKRRGLFNTVVWAVDTEGELPHWLVSADRVRVINIPTPTPGTRQVAAGMLTPALPGYQRISESAQGDARDAYAKLTEGMSFTEMNAAVPIAIDRRIPAERIEESIRFLRSGVQTSPWTEPAVRQSVLTAPDVLNHAVLGQRRAVGAVADVLARAVLGLSGAQSGGHPHRPQGVLFLAGPTGVGKTELAKQIAILVFGREEAMQRWDMSEFSAEHTEARLIGAPPGYAGHDAGGELTNAVRRRPFSLLLFDEVEKAHPRILDKFLQILEDGRLTDGSGSTVHFTESLIVFTSNLGVYEEREGKRVPVVEPGTDYNVLRDRVLRAIHDAFINIGRPELLNRIGDNIIVFDFISPETARDLLRRTLKAVTAQVYARTGIAVSFDPIMPDLDTIVTDRDNLAFGGRRVLACVESRVVSPLARKLLERSGPDRCTITKIWEDDAGHHIDLAGASDRIPDQP